jgi:DNA-binding CsgD family transcriptional regulator
MGSVKSMGNRTGSHTVDPASLRGAARRLGGVQTLPAVMGSTLAGPGFVPSWPILACSMAGGCRERRIAEARDQLRIAGQMLGAIGMEAFAERARRELLTTGERARKRTAQPARTPLGPASGPLTAQEAQVARLAREGMSNPEIGARLFISSRTVQYHLGKVFTKLAISSLRQLHRVLSVDPDTLPRR